MSNVSFSNPNFFATGIEPESVSVGDFNRDGKTDLAIGNATDDTVSILLSDGLGNLTLFCHSKQMKTHVLPASDGQQDQ
jgi:hypothetical protein